MKKSFESDYISNTLYKFYLEFYKWMDEFYLIATPTEQKEIRRLFKISEITEKENPGYTKLYISFVKNKLTQQ